MKKWLIILAAVMVVWTAAAFAENLSGMTDEELLDLYQDLLDEMAYRGLSAGQEADDEQTSVTERVLSFFHAWNKNDFDEMLTLCDSGWKTANENPRMELFRIMANRTALSFEIESIQEIAGEGPDGLSYDMVTATSVLDRNNGMPPKKYRLRFLVRKEEDGLWYINPDGLDELEKAEEEIPTEATAVPGGDADAAMADPVLYYQPNGGEYYHLDQNCKCIHPTYLPLQGVFLYSELNDEPYRNLKPCEICGAPPAPESEGSPSETDETDLPSFRTFKDALNLSYQADGTIQYEAELFTEDYDYDLMLEIADELAAVWENEEPDQEMKEAIIAKLTEEHPEAAEMIRQIVESFH